MNTRLYLDISLKRCYAYEASEQHENTFTVLKIKVRKINIKNASNNTQRNTNQFFKMTQEKKNPKEI